MKTSIGLFLMVLSFSGFCQQQKLKFAKQESMVVKDEANSQWIEASTQSEKATKVFEWKNLISFLEHHRETYINQVIKDNSAKMISQSYIQNVYMVPSLSVLMEGFGKGDEVIAIYYNQNNEVIGKASFNPLVPTAAIKAADGWRGRGRMGEQRVTDRIEIYFKSKENKSAKFKTSITASIQLPTILNETKTEVNLKRYKEQQEINISNNDLTLESIESIQVAKKEAPLDPNAYSISGTIIDGSTGLAIPNAELTLMGEVQTLKDGKYNSEINFDNTSTQTLKASIGNSRYLPAEVSVDRSDLSVDGKIVKNIILLPQQYGKNKVVIVLTWGKNPTDLDSHLSYGFDQTNKSKIYFMSKKDSGNSLDVDNIHSYGPETTTIPLVGGKAKFGNYVFKVTHYKGTGLIKDSGAEVKVYINEVLSQVFHPTQENGITWEVFSMNENAEITEINKINNSRWTESHGINVSSK